MICDHSNCVRELDNGSLSVPQWGDERKLESWWQTSA